MKPSTYTETVEIVRSWREGRLKIFLAERGISYHCAMMRIVRFRRAFPKEYQAIKNVNIC